MYLANNVGERQNNVNFVVSSVQMRVLGSQDVWDLRLSSLDSK